MSPVYTYRFGESTSFVIPDQEGNIRFRGLYELDEGNPTTVVQYRADNKSAWKEVRRLRVHGYRETWEPLSFNRDGRFIYLISREEHDLAALHAFDTATLELGPALFVPEEGEILSPIMSRDGYELRGVSYETDRVHYHWFDEGADRGKLQRSLEAAFPEMDVQFASFSDNERIALIHVGSDREAGVYFVLDRDKGSLDQFERVREVPASLMRPMEPVKYIARDGLEIYGYHSRD